MGSSHTSARCVMFIFSVILNVLLNSRGRQAGFLRARQKALRGANRKPTGCGASRGFDGSTRRDHRRGAHATATSRVRTFIAGDFRSHPHCCTDRESASGPDRSDGSRGIGFESCVRQDAIERDANERTTVLWPRLCLINYFTERSAQQGSKTPHGLRNRRPPRAAPAFSLHATPPNGPDRCRS